MTKDTAYEGCKKSGFSYLIEKHITCNITSGSSFLRSVLGTTLPILAAFTCGCIKNEALPASGSGRGHEAAAVIRMKSSESPTCRNIMSVDIFTFDADSLGHLDSYQRITDISDETITISSTGGRKRIFACCNTGLDKEDMMRIDCMEDLKKTFIRLEDQDRDFPLMLGQTETDTDSAGNPDINIRPMISEIILKTVRCCFEGTVYDNEPITEARVYLTNVNAQCNLAEAADMPERFINMGMLNTNDISAFHEPAIVIQEIGQEITEEVLRTDISLLCFQNHGTNESPGSPFTRLVFEGKIQGHTYYWPITVNRAEEGTGIEAGTRYIYDLTIRRKGSHDPDHEIVVDKSETTMEVIQWKEKEEYTVGF